MSRPRPSRSRRSGSSSRIQDQVVVSVHRGTCGVRRVGYSYCDPPPRPSRLALAPEGSYQARCGWVEIEWYLLAGRDPAGRESELICEFGHTGLAWNLVQFGE